ncbi:MAG: membrane protein insertion efficiency factor YidD [Candidatus Gracilibacteria bacterium]
MPRRVVLFVIRWYQRFFSPDHSEIGKKKYPFGYCRFTPTCSEYAYEAIEKYGVVWGGAKALWRVVRCNPCGKGGYDPVEGDCVIW